jgi:MFS transporter, DHA3 family, multidrug efflux protein
MNPASNSGSELVDTLNRCAKGLLKQPTESINGGMKTFYQLLGVALLAVTTNNFVWFALTFWAFLTTKSVISTSVMAGIFLVLTAISGFWFGSLVDHHRKKHAMLGSSVATLILFLIGLALFHTAPASAWGSVSSATLWIFVVILLSGTLAGTIYNIAIPTLVALIVPEDRRDRANGMFGTTIGIAFGITSVASGISLAFGGMGFVLLAAAIATLLAIVMLALIPIPEREIIRAGAGTVPQTVALPEGTRKEETAEYPPQLGSTETGKGIDIRGTIRAVAAVPGLFALIFFTTFNNFLGGVFFALMDAYGLSLVSVEVWGTLWGILSLSFILGGLYISKKGLGKNPLRVLFRNNIITWTVCVFFTIQPSITLLAVGTFVWMFFIPFTEAIEQTIFQKVVPPERLGRVFGFAHSIEQAASPITAFLIGPIAQLIFIPFMTTGAGVELIGMWFGTGIGRGIALVFMTAGAVGLAVTLVAMRSKAYLLLAERFRREPT